MRSIILVLVCICTQHGAIINGLPNHSYNRLVSPSLQRRMHDVETIKELNPVFEHKTLPTERVPGPNGRFPAKISVEKQPLLPIPETGEELHPESPEIEYVSEWREKKLDVEQMLRLHHRLQLSSDGVPSISFPPTRLVKAPQKTKDSNDIEDSIGIKSSNGIKDSNDIRDSNDVKESSNLKNSKKMKDRKKDLKLEPLLDYGIKSKNGKPKKFKKDQLKWYLENFKVNDKTEFEQEKLKLYLKHYIGQTWDRKDLQWVEGKPRWVLQRYVKQWKGSNLDEGKMIKLGELLGIYSELDDVELITKQSYYYLHSFLYDEGESSKKMLDWYKNAILPSLSTLSQKFLNINLKYPSKEPWWSKEDLATWKWYDYHLEAGPKQFQLLIIQIGEILRLGEKSLVEPTVEEIETMKRDLLDVFKRLPYMIAKPSARQTHRFPTLIADELDVVTQSLAGDSLFSKRMQSIGLTKEEKVTFSNQFLDPHVTDEVLMAPVMNALDIEWLVNGWNPTDAYAFTSALRKLLLKPNLGLIRNIKESSELLNSISPESWIINGKISRESRHLLQYYAKVLDKPDILNKIWVYEWLIYPFYKVSLFSKDLWRKFKSLA